MSSRLLKYLDARELGGRGWIPKYEKKVAGEDPSMGIIAGHYAGMLDEVIGLIGASLLRRAAYANIDIRGRVKDVEREAQEGGAYCLDEAREQEGARDG